MFQSDQKLCGSGSTRRGFTAMALYHKPLGGCPGHQSQSAGRGFPLWSTSVSARRPTEVLMPLVEFCLKHTTSKTNQTAKGQPPGKKGQPLCFRAGYFTLPDVFPHLFPAYHSPLRDEEIFHGIWTGKSGLSQSIKRMWSKTEFGYWEKKAVWSFKCVLAIIYLFTYAFSEENIKNIAYSNVCSCYHGDYIANNQ